MTAVGVEKTVACHSSVRLFSAIARPARVYASGDALTLAFTQVRSDLCERRKRELPYLCCQAVRDRLTQWRSPAIRCQMKTLKRLLRELYAVIAVSKEAETLDRRDEGNVKVGIVNVTVHLKML